MFRNSLFVMGWVVAALVGFWVRQLQTQNQALLEKLKTADKNITQAEEEAHDYYDLYLHEREHAGSTATSALPPAPRPAKPPMLTAPAVKKTAGDASAIAAAQKHVADLEAQLKVLNDDSRVIDERSRNFRQSQDAGTDRERSGLNARLQTLRADIRSADDQLRALRQQKKSPERQTAIQDMQAQRDQLNKDRIQTEAALRSLSAQERGTNAAIHQEVANEKADVAGERAALQQELQRAREDLERARKSPIVSK